MALPSDNQLSTWAVAIEPTLIYRIVSGRKDPVAEAGWSLPPG